MKILLVSDTHGRDERLERALKIEKPDFLCHMGDIEGSEDYFREIIPCPLAMVAGNNDFFSDLNTEVTFELQGFRIFMTHGHYYYVSMGTDRLKEAAKRNGADIVLFGHTHRPEIEKDDSLIVLNPGSLSYPRQEGRKPSYMVMNLEYGKEPEINLKIF